MTKNTKIWINYSVALIISVLLWYNIYYQVKQQWANQDTWLQHISLYSVWLFLSLALMPINVLLETKKWQILASGANPISFLNAFTSYLSGLAISIVTPNRIGEYPGRILYLNRKNTIRLISASVVGLSAQLFTISLFGTLGWFYFKLYAPLPFQNEILAFAIVLTICLGLFYFRFETWLPFFQHFKWARKYNIYAQLMCRFDNKHLFNIVFISALRFCIFTAQYLILLHWMKVDIRLISAFFSATLFYWIMAIIPSIAITELAERGQIGLFLFHHFTTNTVGILGATFSLWFINLIIPAFIGSLLILRTRWLS